MDYLQFRNWVKKHKFKKSIELTDIITKPITAYLLNSITTTT